MTTTDVMFLLPSAALVQRAFRGNAPESEWEPMLHACTSLAKLAQARTVAYATLSVIAPADRMVAAAADLRHIDTEIRRHIHSIDAWILPQLPPYREGADQHTHTVGQVVADMAAAWTVVTRYLHEGRELSTEDIDRLSALTTGYGDYTRALVDGRCVMPRW